MTLRLKLLLPLICLSLLIGAYIEQIWAPRNLAQAEQNHLKVVGLHLDSVVEGMIPLLLGNQLDIVYENLTALKQNNADWMQVQLIHPSGRQIYPLGSAGASGKEEANSRKIEKPIVYLGMNLGKLVVTVDMTPTFDRLRQETGKLELLLFAMLGIMLLTVALTLEAAVRRPLFMLAAAARKLAQEDYEAKLPKQDGDEVGILIDSFSSMRNDLRRKNQELHEEHDRLLKEIDERKQAQEVLYRANRFLRTLSRCNEALVQADDEERLLQTMCRVVVEVGGFAMAWVGYIEHGQPAVMRPHAWFGEKAADFVAELDVVIAEAASDAGPISRALESGKIQVIDDTADMATMIPWRARALDFGCRSAVSLPLVVADEILGTLNICSSEAGSFNESEVEILRELASDLSFGISTLRSRARELDSVRKLGESLEATIRAVATTIEARDPYTAGHQMRVSHLARAIACDMGLLQEQITGIQRGAEIHDIGKIKIPAEMLSRPGKITDLEFQLIQAHSQIGHDILRDIDFPWPIATMVLQHHERMDGSGYPNGLKGEQILLEARIIAVADTVEAMMSHRPYRAGLGMEAAIREIQHGSGTTFDSRAVSACVKVLRSGELNALLTGNFDR
ncbi:MAG: GAF domain-containing protein [Sulfuritalea sp.]|jgi:HD-GYP domain-containing protein (c-di-GMP phosphodiesterase class II)|nr:GAF domain-containing protein [Sulfuritalea sp.]